MSTFSNMKGVKSKKRLLMRQKCEKRSEVLSFKKVSNQFEAPDVQKKFKEGIKHNIAIEVKIQGGDQKKFEAPDVQEIQGGDHIEVNHRSKYSRRGSRRGFLIPSLLPSLKI